MKKRISALCVGLLALGMAGTVQATLIDRGGGLIYDDVLNITWLQDANYAETSGYAAANARDNGSSATDNIFSNGRMGWDAAVAWAAGLSYGGYDNWRLPIITPADATYEWKSNGTGTAGYGATGDGYSTGTPTGGWGTPTDPDGSWSEMGWMWYHNLGNLGYCAPDGGDGNPTTCDGAPQSGWGLVNTSTPDNSVAIDAGTLQSSVYWSGTEYAPNTSDAWSFYTSHGLQGLHNKRNEFYAWAVRSGDVAGVPEPSTILLMGLGLAGLWVAKRGTSRRR